MPGGPAWGPGSGDSRDPPGENRAARRAAGRLGEGQWTTGTPSAEAQGGPEGGSGEASHSQRELGPGWDLNQDLKDPAMQATTPGHRA